MMTFFTLMAALVDLGMVVFQSNVMSEAAAQGARAAIVHGNTTPRVSASWGPGASYPGASPYSVKANSSSDPIALAVQPYLAGLQTSNVTITVQWLDGANAPENRVQVTVSSSWTPVTLLIFNKPITTSASAVMPIVF
jgi:hypothetical protein